MDSLAVGRRKSDTAFTLTETMVSVVVIAILALGALSYRYHAVRHMSIARAQIVGARTAQLLLEDWRATGGSDKYDPSALGLGFASAGLPPADFAGIADLGSTLNGAAYSVNVDGVPMLVALKYKDVLDDPSPEVRLLQLAVVVAFGQLDAETITFSHTHVGYSPVTLATYVRVDGSGG